MVKITFLCVYACVFFCLFARELLKGKIDEFQKDFHIYDKKIQNFRASWMIVKL